MPAKADGSVSERTNFVTKGAISFKVAGNYIKAVFVTAS
jgi:hypothetical protein